jgi:hypothetical protein
MSEIVDKRQKTLYRVGGVAAAIVALLLLLALPDFFTAGAGGVLLPNNFIVILIKLHAGFGGVQVEALDAVNLLDAVLVVLVGVIAIALYPVLKRVGKVWAIIAVTLPFLGLALFFITQGTGRSGIFAAGLIMALLMLSSDRFGKPAAVVGTAAAVLLLVGDIGTAFTFSTVFAVAMSIGYVLYLIWWGLVAWGLFSKAAGRGMDRRSRA